MGCSAEAWKATESVEESEEAITGGTLFTTADHGAPDTSVVKIYMADKQCTATKIGARRFLTAAHCGGGHPGQKIHVSNALNPTAFTELTIAQVFDHPTAFLPNRFPHFDVEIVDVVETSTNIPAYNVIRPVHVSNGTAGDLTAYGCDATDSTHTGKKQHGHFTATTINGPADATLAHYTTTGIETCSGDSGGPFFVKRNNVWEIAGLVAANNFSRVGHVLNWIQDPRHNVFENGSRGFLINRNSEQCLGTDSARAGTTDTRQFYCDGRDSPSGSDHQYWELISDGNGFKFKNTKSGQCLTLFTSLGGTFSLGQTACTSAVRFGVYGTGEYRAFAYYSSGLQRTLCLSVSGTAENQSAALVDCDWVSSEQLWLFSK